MKIMLVDLITESLSLLIHCNSKFKPQQVQFLFNNFSFINRKLEIGVCPHCEHLIAKLTEKRIVDGRLFEKICTRRKATRLINSLKDEIEYTSTDFPKPSKTLFGFRYGENREKINKKTGVSIIIQKACDFYGNKEVVKKTACDFCDD